MDRGFQREYVERQQSIAQISKRLGTTEGRVNYWLKTYGIPVALEAKQFIFAITLTVIRFVLKVIKTP